MVQNSPEMVNFNFYFKIKKHHVLKKSARRRNGSYDFLTYQDMTIVNRMKTQDAKATQNIKQHAQTAAQPPKKKLKVNLLDPIFIK